MREEDSDEPEDEVISQDPAAGSRSTGGPAVTITVSSGPEQVNVPDVVGLSARTPRRSCRPPGSRSVQR